MSETNGAIEPVEPFEVIDGYLVNADGEIVGLATMDHYFMPKTPEEVDWVLRLKMEAEAKILAIEAQRAAINANLDGQLVGPRSRLGYLGFRFDNAITEWAERHLAETKAKTKTIRLTYGSVAFRQAKGKSEITDPDAALGYVKQWAPDRLKYNPVGVGDIEAAMEAEKIVEGEPETGYFLTQAGPRQAVTIKTGIDT